MHPGARITAGLALTLLALVPASVAAQPRERQAEGGANQPQPRCTVRAQAMVPAQPSGPGSALPDAHFAPAAVGTDTGVLIAWRARDGRLFLTRLGAGFARAGEDREVAGPVESFALAPAAGGAALAVVERTRRGDLSVLLARLTGQGEARNVPRELGRGEGIDGVAVAYAGAGYAVAWGVGTREAGGVPGSYVALTDARGVPRLSPVRALDASAPRLVFLPGAEELVLSATTAEGDGRIGMLDGEGVVTDSARWSGGSRWLAAGGSAGASVWSVGAATDASGNTTLALSRWLLTGPAIETASAWRAAPGTSVSAVVPDRAGVAALLDEPSSGRELLVRFAGDGSASLLATRVGANGTVIPTSEGGFTLVGHERDGALSVITLSCPRPPAPPVAPVAPSAPTAAASPAASAASVAPSASTTAGNTAATPSDAGGAATSVDAAGTDP